jgi:hypothetical protein
MWKINLSRKKLIILFVLIFFEFAVMEIMYIVHRKKLAASLETHKKIVTGIILNAKETYGRSNRHSFYVYGFNNNSTISYGNASILVGWQRLIGKKFPVIYDTTNPENNHMLIFPDDFNDWNLPFPDSLKWVLKFNDRYNPHP